MNAKQEARWVKWKKEWDDLAKYDGKNFERSAERIDRVVQIWSQEVEPGWLRQPARVGTDEKKWREDGYRRGDHPTPHRGEHQIEDAILRNLKQVSWFGTKTLRAGLNAVPLAGSKKRVESDMLLLAEPGSGPQFYLTEVKKRANHAWHAVVENLRQLKLFKPNSENFRTYGVFARHLVSIRGDLPVSGVVLGPKDFYKSEGQKENAVAPAQILIERLRVGVGVDLILAVWDEDKLEVTKLES